MLEISRPQGCGQLYCVTALIMQGPVCCDHVCVAACPAVHYCVLLCCLPGHLLSCAVVLFVWPFIIVFCCAHAGPQGPGRAPEMLPRGGSAAYSTQPEPIRGAAYSQLPSPTAMMPPSLPLGAAAPSAVSGLGLSVFNL